MADPGGRGPRLGNTDTVRASPNRKRGFYSAALRNQPSGGDKGSDARKASSSDGSTACHKHSAAGTEASRKAVAYAR